MMAQQEQQHVIAIAAQDASKECAVSAADVARLARVQHVWRCPGCEHVIRFQTSQAEAIPFFIVRHLLRIHGVAPDRIASAEPALAADVRDYCRQMDVRG